MMRIQNILFCLLILCMAWGLKFHYSLASPEALKWILAPTAATVEVMTGHLFSFEAGAGYINPDLMIVIAPACAGANFLIAVWCMSAFCGIFRLIGWKTKCIWLISCAAGAFIATVSVNAVRIGISIAMITSDFHWGWLTPQRAHRMTGILIYFFFLCLFYPIIQKLLLCIQSSGAEKRIKNPGLVGVWPLAWYWAIVILVPGLNAAYTKDPAGFFEHSLTVMVLSLSIHSALTAVNSFIKKQKVELHATQNTHHRRRAGHHGHHRVRS